MARQELPAGPPGTVIKTKRETQKIVSKFFRYVAIFYFFLVFANIFEIRLFLFALRNNKILDFWFPSDRDVDKSKNAQFGVANERRAVMSDSQSAVSPAPTLF